MGAAAGACQQKAMLTLRMRLHPCGPVRAARACAMHRGRPTKSLRPMQLVASLAWEHGWREPSITHAPGMGMPSKPLPDVLTAASASRTLVGAVQVASLQISDEMGAVVPLVAVLDAG